MVSYLFRRLLLIIIVLFGLSVLTFTIARIIPADPVMLAAGPRASKEQIEALRVQYGYDKPLVEQYFNYIRDLSQGNLGRSVVLKREVGPDLATYFPATLELVLASMLIAFVLGLPLGIAAAVYQDRWPDQISRFLSLGGVSVPNFWLAIILQLTAAFTFSWLQISGRFDRIGTPPQTITGMYTLDALLSLDFTALRIALSYLILPAFCLSLGALATIARTVRADMIEILSSDHIRTARA